MIKKLTIHNLEINILRSIENILTHFGENFPTMSRMVPVSNIYCQERRILFVAGKRTLVANISRPDDTFTEIRSTRVINTPNKYRRD